VEFVHDGTVAKAVNGVSFSIARGETLAIAGESAQQKRDALALSAAQDTSRRQRTRAFEPRRPEMTPADLRQIAAANRECLQDALSRSIRYARSVRRWRKLFGAPNLRGAAARRRSIDFLGRVGIHPGRSWRYPTSSAAGCSSRDDRDGAVVRATCAARDERRRRSMSVCRLVLELLRSVTEEFRDRAS